MLTFETSVLAFLPLGRVFHAEGALSAKAQRQIGHGFWGEIGGDCSQIIGSSKYNL